MRSAQNPRFLGNVASTIIQTKSVKAGSRASQKMTNKGSGCCSDAIQATAARASSLIEVKNSVVDCCKRCTVGGVRVFRSDAKARSLCQSL